MNRTGNAALRVTNGSWIAQRLRPSGRMSILALRGVAHAGIIVCTRDDDVVALAARLHQRLQETPTLPGQLLRVTRPSS